jgi:hypothetical protein
VSAEYYRKIELVKASLAAALRRLEKVPGEEGRPMTENVSQADILIRMAAATLDGAPVKHEDQMATVRAIYTDQLSNDKEYEFLDNEGGFWSNCESCGGQLVCFGWGDGVPAECEDCKQRLEGDL